jgi:hypothetical protein
LKSADQAHNGEEKTDKTARSFCTSSFRDCSFRFRNMALLSKAISEAEQEACDRHHSSQN